MKIHFDDREVSEKLFNTSGKRYGGKLAYRRLYEPFAFSIDDDDFKVLPGFWWDGASIPRALWSVVGDPWDEDITPGALIHDILYGSHWFSQRKADDILFKVNKLNDMGWLKNHTVWATLRVCGHVAYNGKTEKGVKGVRKHVLVNDCQMPF